MSSMLVKKKIAAALRGAFIADAASMGTHWIYQPSEMLQAVASVDQPEFKTPPQPRFYSTEDFPGHYKAGMLSPYGEQLLFVADHVGCTPDLNGASMSEEMWKWSSSFGGRPDAALKVFQENMAKGEHWPHCGADDDQAHIYMKVVPVVARYVGCGELLTKVTDAIRVHQNNDKAVAFGIAAARLLESVILGAPLEEALETVEINIGQDLESVNNPFKEEVLKAWERAKKGAKETKDKTLDELLKEFSHERMVGKEDSPFYDLAGRSCALPGSFIGPIFLFYKYASGASSTSTSTSSSNTWVAAVRENILGSGDTCSRAVFVGAVLAAVGGDNKDDTAGVIPDEWVQKMDGDTLEKIDAAIRTIAKQARAAN